MDSVTLADKILESLGETPYAYHELDKWPSIVAIVFIKSLPFIFILLFISPFLWMWYKKKKWNWKTIGIATLRGIGMLILGVIALFALAGYLQGLAFLELNGLR